MSPARLDQASLIGVLEARKFRGSLGDYELGNNDALDEAIALLRQHEAESKEKPLHCQVPEVAAG